MILPLLPLLYLVPLGGHLLFFFYVTKRFPFACNRASSCCLMINILAGCCCFAVVPGASFSASSSSVVVAMIFFLYLFQPLSPGFFFFCFSVSFPPPPVGFKSSMLFHFHLFTPSFSKADDLVLYIRCLFAKPRHG